MLLKADSITKTFGAVKALKGVSFDLRAGEVWPQAVFEYGVGTGDEEEDERDSPAWPDRLGGRIRRLRTHVS